MSAVSAAAGKWLGVPPPRKRLATGCGLELGGGALRFAAEHGHELGDAVLGEHARIEVAVRTLGGAEREMDVEPELALHAQRTRSPIRSQRGVGIQSRSFRSWSQDQ